jgi:uncharacterized protein (DUF1015 family)
MCPPYDIISEREATALRAASPYNAIHLELPEPEPGDRGGASRYARAAGLLADWRAQGVLAREASPCLYAVEETFAWQGTEYRRRGVLAAVRLTDWAERAVLPHERTLAAPKADRLELLRACATNLSPIFMLHPPQDAAEAELWGSLTERAPTAQVALPDGRRERVWAVPANEGGLLAALAGSVLYIADGHHRYETALRYRDERRAAGSATPQGGQEYVLTYLVSMRDPGLLVLPTHRCLPAGGVEAARLEALLSEHFEVERIARPSADAVPQVLAELGRRGASGPALALYRTDELLFLQPKPAATRWLPADRHPAWQALDVAQLESLLLAPLLGPDAAESLTYTRDATEAAAEVDAGRAACAVLLNPTRAEQIAAVADAGERMPQKSTYFYPKLSTGLVFHALDDVAIV